MASVQKNASQEAINICQDAIEFEAAAQRVLIIWRSVAAAHSKTGDYQRSLGVTRELYRGPLGKGRDWVVYTSDPEALAIEYGHKLFSDNDHDGTAEDTGKYVAGLRLGNRAYDIAAASGG